MAVPQTVGRLFVANDTNVSTPGRKGFEDTISFTFSSDSMPVGIGDNASASDALAVVLRSGSLESAAAVYAVDRIGSFNETYPGSARRMSFQGKLTSVELERMIANVTLDSGLQQLNIEVVSKPADPAVVTSMFQLFSYWADLAKVPVASALFGTYSLTIPAPLLPGFQGNLWDNIKQFCAANRVQLYSYAGTKWITNTRPKIRELNSAAVKLRSARTDPVRFLDIAYYNYAQATNGIFFAAQEVYSLGAGEVQTFDVQCVGTPRTLNQPVAVTGISPYPYVGGTGQYVVTGSDGYIVAPDWWTDNGGSVKVAPHATAPDQVTVTISAPSNTSRAPYRISEGGADRPALYITGTGITEDRKTVRIPTGYVGPAQEVDEIDNKFVSTLDQAFTLGSEAAYRRCGATLTATVETTVDAILPALQPSSVAGDVPGMESLAGSVLRVASGMHTIKSMALDNSEKISLQTEHTTTVAEFNEWWTGYTIADFNSFTANIDTDMTSFAMQPLMRRSLTQPQ